MAKKQERKPGQLPFPSAHKGYKTIKLNWLGLNKRQTINSGGLSAEMNVSTHEYPYMSPCEGRKEIIKEFIGGKTSNSAYFNPIGLYAFENVLIALYGDKTAGGDGYSIYLKYVFLDDKGDVAIVDGAGGEDAKAIFSAVVKTFSDYSVYVEDCKQQRSIVLFNQYDNNANVLDGEYTKKLIILPDKKTLNFGFEDYYTALNRWLKEDDERTAPKNAGAQYAFENGIIKYNDICCIPTKYNVDSNEEITKYMYYKWDAQNNKAISLNGSGGENSAHLVCDNLVTYDPVSYYNDGYVKTEDDEAIVGKNYYERTNSSKPYSYKKVNVTFADESDSVEGLYERIMKCEYEYSKTNDEKPAAGKEYWTMYGNSYIKDDFVDTLGFAENIDYYERSVKSKSYEFVVTADEVAQEGKTYFKKNGENEYVITETKTKTDGTNVSGYYEYNDDLTPSGAASGMKKTDLKLNTYYFNTYDSMIYLFVEDDENGIVTVEEKTGAFKISSICAFPDIDYAVVHQSRLFGVGNGRVYVSGFNDYANWNFDSINESYGGNAWMTTAQSNTKAGGDFTGISVYDNHVCCFKSDFMHEIYGSQNPFRLVDIGAIGTIDNRSIREVNGRLIFVTEDGVKMYAGSVPKEIGYELGIDRFRYAVAGSDNRYYYLSCEEYNGEKHFFVYDTQIGAWSERSSDDGEYAFLAVGIAKAEHGMYMMTDRGYLYRLDSGEYTEDVAVSYKKGDTMSDGNTAKENCTKIERLPIEWFFETDLTTGTSSSTGYRSVDIKHIRKIQFMAELPDGEAGFKVYILCDDEDIEYEKDKTTLKKPWQLVYESYAGKKGMFPVRIKPRKTAHYGYRLRFEGFGYAKIHEIEVHMRQGGELYDSE